MSAKLVKSCALAVFTSICGFAAAPAFAQDAASVIQSSDQNIVQNGSGNVAVQGNVQTGIVNQVGNGVAYPGIQCFVAPCPVSGINGATVVQGNHQNIHQVGVGNTAIQGNSSAASVFQGAGGYPFPYYGVPGINGAQVVQGNVQDAAQSGVGNTAIQGNSAEAIVLQH
ncbi:hypothetical protein [Myxacorys almedinensis]|uniref:Curlin n=1 Tax=Myxacorys almedinensis A TaxID=2690445 RepID=A0A8J7Z373_9CYAN|nr:hypothetical protein [Myxacorys almedinensis]NDJ16991.1 hypothetical protein [Myxacorys almedinensis A]